MFFCKIQKTKKKLKCYKSRGKKFSGNKKLGDLKSLNFQENSIILRMLFCTVYFSVYGQQVCQKVCLESVVNTGCHDRRTKNIIACRRGSVSRRKSPIEYKIQKSLSEYTKPEGIFCCDYTRCDLVFSWACSFKILNRKADVCNFLQSA